MKLSEFVRDTLVQIVEGVRTAQESTGEAGALVNPSPFNAMPTGQGSKFTHRKEDGAYLRIQQVRFDVALTTTEGSTTGGGGGVAVVGVFKASASGEASESSSSAGRIQFEVDIALPRPLRPAES